MDGNMSENAQRDMVHEIVMSAQITDMHTHLFPPSFKSLQMSGADNVLTYHYLIAESMRVGRISYESFFSMDLKAQAEFIWERLFQTITPLSEAASGVAQIAQMMGVHLRRDGLSGLREALTADADDAYVDKVLSLAGVEHLVMTNDPFSDEEQSYWKSGAPLHPRFHAALRLDPLVNTFEDVIPLLVKQGYSVTSRLTDETVSQVRRFLEDCVERIHPLYVAFSASDTFEFGEEDSGSQLLRRVVLPLCEERRLPLALMIGAKRRVNPGLQSAGDSTGKASIQPVERLCREYPNNKFLVSLLSRENQHELAVTARKFDNLMPFGCWWFLNTESLIDEITRMRLELLGPTFVAQHSDARVLEHVLYKWQLSRKVIADVLSDKYEALSKRGWPVTRADVERDVAALFGKNFWDFVAR